MKLVLAPSILLLLLAFTSLAMAQSPEPKRIAFHVLEVRQSPEPAEGHCVATDQCSVTKIEVSGSTRKNRQTILYSLECFEVVVAPNAKRLSNLCINVRAGEDYPARISPTAVMFGEDQHVGGATIVLYNIVSQREVREPQK